jgi:tetratricopeptide (TPR) repeat protein
MLEAFHAAGVRHIVLAVESGSERVLKEVMRKPLKFGISKRVATDCRELGIYTNTNILIGSPGETMEDIAHARRNLRDLATNWFNIYCTSPLDGSEMHELSLRKGYIPADAMGSDYHKAVISTEDFTAEDIARIQYEMNLELNFVHNYDMRMGEFATALRGFANVIRIRPEHAFAYYFAASCYSALGDEENYLKHRDGYIENVKLPLWRGYADLFELESAPPRHTEAAIADLVVSV